MQEKKTESLILGKELNNVVRIYEFYHDQAEEICGYSMDYYQTNLKHLILSKGSLDLKTFFPLFTDILSGQ